MTTQPNQDDVAVFMEEVREQVTAVIYGADWRDDHDIENTHKPDVEAIMRLLQQSNRQLLDEVEAAGPTDSSSNNWDYAMGYNSANSEWYDAIQAIKERRGL